MLDKELNQFFLQPRKKGREERSAEASGEWKGRQGRKQERAAFEDGNKRLGNKLAVFLSEHDSSETSAGGTSMCHWSEGEEYSADKTWFLIG